LSGNTNPANITIDNDKTVTATFTLVSRTYVPDDNFEQALIDLGYDDVLDDYVDTNNINSITNLIIANKNIADLIGIEDFISLQNLACFNNQITSIQVPNSLIAINIQDNLLTHLDLSANLNLLVVKCGNNNISNLQLPTSNTLTTIECEENQLTHIDVSGYPNLEILNIYNNNISSINIVNCTNLEELDAGYNPLSSLDISNNTALTYFNISNTSIGVLDLSNHTNIVEFACNNAQMTDLNIRNGNNTAISDFDANNNPNLTCIFVDNATYSTTSWTNIGTASHFVETQAQCDALSIDNETLTQDIDIYPNPTANTIHIDSSENVNIKKVSIYNVEGKLLWTQNNAANISIQEYEAAVYFIKIETDNGVMTKQIIKQ
jgi:hypothetical protein